jgi:hypothetical protein
VYFLPIVLPGLIGGGARTGGLPRTGFTVGVLGFLAVTLIFVGLVLLRSLTVELEPQHRR